MSCSYAAPVHRTLAVTLIVAAWAAALGLGVATASGTAVGPVVLRLNRYHGLHAGDAAALAVGAAWASLLTVTLAGSAPGRG